MVGALIIPGSRVRVPRARHDSRGAEDGETGACVRDPAGPRHVLVELRGPRCSMIGFRLPPRDLRNHSPDPGDGRPTLARPVPGAWPRRALPPVRSFAENTASL